MPKRKEPELDPKEQAKRFREAAKESEVDAEKAEKAFRSVSQKKRFRIPAINHECN